MAALSDEKLHPRFNNAAYGTFPAGSTFQESSWALAGLESGILDPNEIYHSAGYSCSVAAAVRFADTADRAISISRGLSIKSSNPYFIHYGPRIGRGRLVEMGHRFHFGERTGISQGLEAKGYSLPPAVTKAGWSRAGWMEIQPIYQSARRDSCYCPLQMLAWFAAWRMMANSSSLVSWQKSNRKAKRDPKTAISFPAGVVRSEIHVSPHSLDLVRQAMLADVQHPEGTGHRASICRYKICAKDAEPPKVAEGSITWFVSFHRTKNPQYAVVVVVSGAGRDFRWRHVRSGRPPAFTRHCIKRDTLNTTGTPLANAE